jgi:hypothetical protein
MLGIPNLKFGLAEQLPVRFRYFRRFVKKLFQEPKKSIAHKTSLSERGT